MEQFAKHARRAVNSFSTWRITGPTISRSLAPRGVVL